ncbi:MAG: M15 family metallopeptidase, partial [Clostridia bacterium]|nr:M15 family metallopeptidase [Clostridia bacterium]
MKKLICIIIALVIFTFTVSCGKAEDASKSANDEAGGIDYLVLVNKENKLPDGWEEKLETVTVKNSLGDDVEVEKSAYDAYLRLKDALAAEGVYVDLDSARRSVSEQQRIWDDFMEKYGESYTKRTVAVPGYSEHHTGLALDLYLNIDGEDVYMNEDMVEYPEIWAKIHEKLADYGFILRYLEGKEAITGYGYEPWHIRYVGTVEIAKEIASKGITFEEYLNRLPEGDVAPPAEEASEEIEGIYLGVKDYGAPETNKENRDEFIYRFKIDGEEVTYKIMNGTQDEEGNYDYPIQNALKEGYGYSITVKDGVVTAASEVVEAGSFDYSPRVSGIPGEKTLKNFLLTALEPVGTTLYIYGG